MAKQAIEQIRAAETEAQRIKDAIPVRVKAVLDEAERHRKEICVEAEQTAEAETNAQLGQMRERAERLLERSAAEADSEAEAARKAARQKMPDAVKLIVWGIMAKWQ